MHVSCNICRLNVELFAEKAMFDITNDVAFLQVFTFRCRMRNVHMPEAYFYLQSTLGSFGVAGATLNYIVDTMNMVLKPWGGRMGGRHRGQERLRWWGMSAAMWWTSLYSPHRVCKMWDETETYSTVGRVRCGVCSQRRIRHGHRGRLIPTLSTADCSSCGYLCT